MQGFIRNKSKHFTVKIKDYYKILGVQRTASTVEIRIAYYSLARKYHPDMNPNNKECIEKFNEIAEAYRVLGNLDNRIKYINLLRCKDNILHERELNRMFSKNKKIKV